MEVLMELFLHSAAGATPTVVEVDETMTVRQVLEVFGSGHDGFWIEETEEEVDATLTLEQAHIHHRQDVHHHRCRRIEVLARHIDEERKREFAPASTVGRVLIWTLGPEGFNIPEEQRPEYGFLSCHDGKAVPNNTHVGSLTGAGTGCEVCLSLVRKQNPQG